MASDVMTNEEFRAHIKRMVTWMEVTEQSYDPVTEVFSKSIEVCNALAKKKRCPHCDGILPDETD